MENWDENKLRKVVLSEQGSSGLLQTFAHPLSSGRSINLSFSLQIVRKYFAVETQKFVRLLPSNPLPLTCITQVRAVLGVSERG